MVNRNKKPTINDFNYISETQIAWCGMVSLGFKKIIMKVAVAHGTIVYQVKYRIGDENAPMQDKSFHSLTKALNFYNKLG